ncbi:hypothetical protein KP509_1Z008700 [Ceratopteris richardii]|nr:hypothetical protein KP509_1Z008700 [Ceratopteris richardii]
MSLSIYNNQARNKKSVRGAPKSYFCELELKFCRKNEKLGSARRGMTVLGKIPAVPKPINLPSQRLENRGLDPSVEIVPRGTFSWGSGRSPPTSGNSWGSVGLSSSPPVATGAWSTPSATLPTSSSITSGGGANQNPPRPLSAGSTRPSSAGSVRPLSASVGTGRAWASATKPEEQIQPSRFNLTTAEFPTLGSEKNPSLRPHQNATKERHLTYQGPYQSGMLVDRPTSADGNKERKPVYPDTSHLNRDRPTSADGTHKGRQLSDPRSSMQPPLADSSLPDQRHAYYTGVGHGTAGPGPGMIDRPNENYGSYPPTMLHGRTTIQGREFAFPVASQHDIYFNRPRSSHGNDMSVPPMDGRSDVYTSHHMDVSSNHPDLPGAHHAQSNWVPNQYERPGLKQGQFIQVVPPEHFNVMQQAYHHPMETTVPHERPAVGSKRDGYSITDKGYVDQRSGWTGRNAVYTGSHLDARESSISMSGTGQEFPRPDVFLPSWGHQSMHAGWGDMYGGEMGVRMYQEVPPVIHQQQIKLIERIPQGPLGDEAPKNVTLERSGTKGVRRADDSVNPSLLGPKPDDLGCSSVHPQNMHNTKQEEAIKGPVKISVRWPDMLTKKNNLQASEGPLVSNQQSNQKQEEETATWAEHSKDSQNLQSVSNAPVQKEEENYIENFQVTDKQQVVIKDISVGCKHDAKERPLNKRLSSFQKSTKEMKESNLLADGNDEKASSIKASERNLINNNSLSSAQISSVSGKENNNDNKEASGGGKQLKSVENDVKGPLASDNMALAGDPSAEKINLDDISKIKRNGHPARRGHHGRPAHDTHPSDRQHSNHGLVWAPKPLSTSFLKEDSQPPAGDADILEDESSHRISVDIARKGALLPMTEHENHGENEIQQMQSAAGSQQGQEIDVLDHSIVGGKRQLHQAQHKRAERGSKKQGHKQQQQQTRSSATEQTMSEEKPTCEDQSLQVEHQKSVKRSHEEYVESQAKISTFALSEPQARHNHQTEETQKASKLVSISSSDKSEGKKNKEENTTYIRKPMKNQQRPHEQDNEARNNHDVQDIHSKGEKSSVYEQDNLISETPVNSVTRKNQRDVRLRNARGLKQQKADSRDSATNSGAADERVFGSEKFQPGASGESRLPSLAAETKVFNEKEEGIHNQRSVRHQEVLSKQFATGRTEVHRHAREEQKDVFCPEPVAVRSEKKLYVPKQARKESLQGEPETVVIQSQGMQWPRNEEVHSSSSKAQHDRHGSQPLSAQTNRKNDIERYTPLPARQLNMQGHQSAARIQRGHRTSDLPNEEIIQSSSGHIGIESSSREPPSMSDSSTKFDESQFTLSRHKEERKVHEPSESGSNRKETKQYVVKPTRQQQPSAPIVDEEVPMKEKKWQKSSRSSGSDSYKSKEGIKLYTPVPARQVESSACVEGKLVKETGELSLADKSEPLKDRKARNREMDRPSKDGNLAWKTPSSASLHHLQKKTQLQTEVKLDTQHVLQGNPNSLMSNNMNEGHKEDKKDQESYHKAAYRGTNDSKEDKKEQDLYQRAAYKGNSDSREDPNSEEMKASKPRQFHRRHYQYQPVAQHLRTSKLQTEDYNDYNMNNKSLDHGHSRYERRDGPRRGRGHGYGYKVSEHADSSDSK